MLSVAAYYNGNNYVTEQAVAVQPNQKVIITYLDDAVSVPPKKTLAEIRSYMKGGKSVPDGISTVDYVRSLRAE